MQNKKLMTYINNWDRVHNDVLDKESQMLSNNIPHKIINSSSQQKEGWINIGSNAWCYRQIFEVFKDAYKNDYDYISLLFGDIYCPDEKDFAYYVNETYEKINSLPDCYVYSTSFTHDGWSYPQTILKHYDEDVAYVCGTDTLYITLNKNVYRFAASFLHFFDKKHGIDNFASGWAVDIICSLYSIYNRKNVFRNKKTILVHYENSGYNVDKAYNEMNLIISEAINYMVEYMDYNREILNSIHEMMMQQRVVQKYDYNSFYGA